MRIALLGTVCDNKGSIIEYRMVNADNGDIVDKPKEVIVATLEAGKNIIGLKLDGKNIVGSNGAIDRYNKYCGNRIVKSAIIVDRAIMIDGEILGYYVIQPEGKIVRLRADELISNSNKINIANGKWVTKGDKTFISAINGNYECVDESEKIVTKVVQVDKGVVARSHSARIRSLVHKAPAGSSMMHDIDENTGMTVEEKITYAVFAVKDLRPYYYAVLSNMNKYETFDLPTAGVAMSKLYFNPTFVKEMSLPELVFTMLHEILHIAMCHESRKGSREHTIWNYACDFYINKLLQVELGLGDNFEVVAVKRAENALNKNRSKVDVKMPEWVLYEKSVDIVNDTPESIYKELIENMQDNSQGNGSQGNGSKGNSQGSGEEGQGSKSSGNTGGKQDGNENTEGGTGNGKENGNDNKNGNGSGRKTTFRGREYKINDEYADLVADQDSSKMSDAQKKQSQKSFQRRAKQTAKQQKLAGDTAGILERMIEQCDAEKVDWKKTLRGLLSKMYERINSFSSPDRRFISRKMTLPGAKEIEHEGITEVVIAIDTSGSISDKDLGIVFKQFLQLCKQYKANGVIMYWDVVVQAVYEFKDDKEALKAKPKGGGGTDVNCVFEYFMTNTDYVKRRKKMPEVLMIFTDGYFGQIDSKYAKKFKNTIFVIQEGVYDGFEVPFGRKAVFKNEE